MTRVEMRTGLLHRILEGAYRASRGLPQCQVVQVGMLGTRETSPTPWEKIAAAHVKTQFHDMPHAAELSELSGDRQVKMALIYSKVC
jgi:hypothetical protein